jgi:hypothetical protein
LSAQIANMAALTALTKQYYVKDRPVNIAAGFNRPMLKWFKRKMWTGESYTQPIILTDPQSAGLRSLQDAVAYAENAKAEKFVITDTADYYGSVQVDAKAMLLTKDTGAFVAARKLQVDGMLRQQGKMIHLDLFRSGTGSIGRIASIGGSGTELTLTNKSDTHNFGKGQPLIANNTDDAVSLKTGGVKVTKINHSAGVLTVDTDVEGLTSAWAANDYLFPISNAGSGMKGLGAWLPLTAPGATAFHGVDRTVNIAALSGHRLDESSRGFLTNAQELAMLIHEFGGQPDVIVTNPRTGLRLVEELDAKVTRVAGGTGKEGFEGFRLISFTGGGMDVMFDMGCPPGLAYMLQRDTWCLTHVGEFLSIIADDGVTALRSPSGEFDGIEIRCRSFCELACAAPGYNGVFSVAVD